MTTTAQRKKKEEKIIMVSNRIVKAVFNMTLTDMLWALEEEAKNADETVNERFSCKEIVSQHNNLINRHTVEVIGTAQAIMFLCGRVAGAGEDYLHSIKTIKNNQQWCGKYRYDNADGEKGTICLI